MLLLEGKRDQEILRDFLGDDYYDKYTSIKNKIKDPEYKDIYKLIKKDPNDVKDYIDSFQSNTDVRRNKKSDGASVLAIKELIKYGCDVNEVLDSGENLLDLAKRTPNSSRPVILNLLENAMRGNKIN